MNYISIYKTQVSEASTIRLVLLFLLCTLIACLNVVSPLPQAHALTYGSGTYNNCAYGGPCSISIVTSGSVNISLLPTTSSVYSIQKDAVVVQTDNPLGYNLSLESSSASSTSLVNGGYTLAASSGTPASPQVLQLNTWGFRIDGSAGFGAGPTTSATNATSSSLTFAGLTLNGSPQTIYTRNVASAGGGDTIDVWYGTRANTSVASGTYQQTVIYTATTLP